MKLQTLAAGARGIDCNTNITPSTGAALVAKGYEFVLRYVPRLVPSGRDLTGHEIEIIHAAGLGVMIVQHVESESSWFPTAAKGTQYAGTAVRNAQTFDMPAGSILWLDLEGVDPSVEMQDVIDYCNAWDAVVTEVGFQSGLYVGWHAGIDATSLYTKLRTKRYWAAYNLNSDQYPVTRGVQMRQHEPTASDVPDGLSTGRFDVNIIQADALGDLPTMALPT